MKIKKKISLVSFLVLILTINSSYILAPFTMGTNSGLFVFNMTIQLQISNTVFPSWNITQTFDQLIIMLLTIRAVK